METTFDKFINNDSKRKEKFEKEYNEFLASEIILRSELEYSEKLTRGNVVDYETKVILIAIANILGKSKTLEEAYISFEMMANAEGVNVPPSLEDMQKKCKNKKVGMCEDIDKICRTIFYQVKKAKTLNDAINAVKIVIGPDNASAVIAQLKEEEKDAESEVGKGNG